MGTSDANNTTAHVAEPPSPSTTPPTPTPTPTPGPSSDVSVSSVVALLIDAQDKLERQRQLRWSKLTKSQNSRAEYTDFINTALKDVEEQAKRRNRVQLASFLRHEGRTREAGHGRIEEALAALELRWQKAHDALAASLGNILLEARHEEQEWNEMLRRLGAEEQARLADELPVMLRTAIDAWKTEDQAEESWRNAWETTNLTLERLSQRIQQQQQPLPSSQPQPSPRRQRRSSSSSNADEGSSNADSQVVLERRRSTVTQTRRMTVTRRQIEASTTSSSSSSLLSSLSMSLSETLNTPIMDPENDTHSHARSAREYMYSPIKNQMPGQELFDESLERISPDPNTKRGMDVNNHNACTPDNIDFTFTSAAGPPMSRSIPSGTGAPSSSSLHPLSTRSRSNKIKIKTNDDEEKQNIDSGTGSATDAREDDSVSKNTPVDSPTRRPSQRHPPSHLPSQPQPQTQPRRATSMKRVSSNTSMKTSASTSSKARATGSGAKDVGPNSHIKKSTSTRTATAKPRSQSHSHSPSTSTDNGTTTTSRKWKEGTSPRSTSTSTPTPTLPIPTPSTPSSSSPSSAWTDYETRWRNLKSSSSLTFSSIPWPIAGPTSAPIIITDIEGIDPQLVGEFILSPSSSEQQSVSPNSNGASSSISTKKRIRAALLRWHPDRFNATILKNVVKSDRKAVQDGVGKVVRILNEMLAKEGGGGNERERSRTSD